MSDEKRKWLGGPVQNIPMSWVLRHCEGATRQGVSVEAVLQDSLIEPFYGDDRDQVSFDQFGLLMLNTARWLEDESSGLGQRPIPSGLSTLAAHVALGCSTLEYAIRAIAQLYRSTDIHFGVVADGDDALVAVHANEAVGGPRAYMLEDLFADFIFGVMSYFLARPLPLRTHQTRDPLHANLNGRHWGTFAPVHHARIAGLRIPRSLLAAPRVNQGSDQVWWHMLQSWVALADGHGALAEQRFVSVEDLRVDTLAAAAGVSASTLRRQMTRSHGGFRAVRRKLVVDASLQLLRSSSRSTEAIAAELGYADSRSFRRFIKSATGKTPEALRAEPLRTAPPASLLRERLKAAALIMSV